MKSHWFNDYEDLDSFFIYIFVNVFFSCKVILIIFFQMKNEIDADNNVVFCFASKNDIAFEKNIL